MVLNECPVPSRLSRGTGRDGIGTGFSKWDGIVPTLSTLHFCVYDIVIIQWNVRLATHFSRFSTFTYLKLNALSDSEKNRCRCREIPPPHRHRIGQPTLINVGGDSDNDNDIENNQPE